MADRKQTKTIGEHWTCAELARRGWAPALTRDAVERTDVLAAGAHLPSRPMIEIQVKTARGESKATSWLLGTKSQLPAKSSREWFVLVAVPREPSQPRGFVVPRDHVAAAAWIVHMNWLLAPDQPVGKRNLGPDRARIRREVFEGYEGRWDLLEHPTSSVPVLLAPWVRQRGLDPVIGLPPDHPWQLDFPNW